VEPFVDGYYKVGETKKARELLKIKNNLVKERLTYTQVCRLLSSMKN